MGLCNYCWHLAWRPPLWCTGRLHVFSIEDGAPRQRDLNDSKLLAAVHLILR